MSAEQVQRPNFFEGQYLGAADLDLAVEYNRFALARHALGAHTWGIVVGLELAAMDSGGGKDVYMHPGMAIDGFGRQIIVNEAVKLTAELFDDVASSLSGNCTVWIRFSGEPFSSPSEGFRNCEDQESFARLQEGYEIIVTSIANASTSDQNDPVVIAGESIDAIEAPVAGDSSKIHCDASVPYQTLPSTEEDSERCWLVLLGFVKWNFSSGAFDLSAPIDLVTTRRYRRYLGSVAEEVLAADGLIRLRKRDTSLGAGVTASSACAVPALKDTSTDLSDTVNPVDLVWVEGHLRVIGDTKLFGGQLDLRRLDGETDGTSLLVRRVESNPLTGKDLQLAIGSVTEGKNRLAVGPISPSDSLLQDKFVVLDNGKIGVQVSKPEHDVQVGDGTNAVTLALRGPSANLAGTLAFQSNAGIASDWFQWAHDVANNRLALDSASYSKIISVNGAAGRVGIGTDQPEWPLTVRAQDTSEKLVGFEAPDGTAKWHINQNLNGTRDGLNFVETNVKDGRLFLKAGGAAGINTVEPQAALHVYEHDATKTNMTTSDGTGLLALGGVESRNLVFDDNAIQARNNRSVSHLALQPLGGNVGIGTEAPGDKLEVRGEVRLGIAGTVFAVSSPRSAVAIVAGRVTVGGDRNGGDDFVPNWLSEGEYRVQFLPSFTEVPSVVVTPMDSSSRDSLLTVYGASASEFHVSSRDAFPGNEGNPKDTAFTFVAVGKRAS